MRRELGLEAAPFYVVMHGADEDFVAGLAEEVVMSPTLAPPDRKSTVNLLLMTAAAILGSEVARRILHMESIIQDPNVQELIREWEDKGRAEGRVEGCVETARSLLLRVLNVRSLPVTPDVRARIDAEHDAARLARWAEAAVTAATLGDVFRDG